MTRPSIERLRELLIIDEASGRMFWRLTRNGRAVAGQQVGSEHSGGYLEMQVEGYKTLVHVIAFSLYHGRYPTNWVDHIDRNKKNNRKKNLREASPSESARNTTRQNKTGFRGVYLRRGSRGACRYYAQLKVGSVRKQLGTFASAAEAAAAYDRAALNHFGTTFPTNAGLGYLS